MKKLLYAICINAALACAAAAQTVVVESPNTQGQTAAKAEDCGCEGR